MYGDGDRRTNFGKALFAGMAYAAGAGSIITFPGAARGPAAAGMFKEFTGRDTAFFELTQHPAYVPRRAANGFLDMALSDGLSQAGKVRHAGSQKKRRSGLPGIWAL